ncbi:MAG TPA: VanZ family protein [Desulfuromonadales bacterium]|nr:VanZ family protein [Desulfuromonadales bacterium]
MSLTSTQSPVQTDLIAYEDKISHALAYAVLAFLGERTWRNLPMARRAWLWSLFVALFIGAALEIAQMTFTRARTAEWGDLIADGVGAGLALALVGWRSKKRRQSLQ